MPAFAEGPVSLWRVSRLLHPRARAPLGSAHPRLEGLPGSAAAPRSATGLAGQAAAEVAPEAPGEHGPEQEHRRGRRARSGRARLPRQHRRGRPPARLMRHLAPACSTSMPRGRRPVPLRPGSDRVPAWPVECLFQCAPAPCAYLVGLGRYVVHVQPWPALWSVALTPHFAGAYRAIILASLRGEFGLSDRVANPALSTARRSNSTTQRLLPRGHELDCPISTAHRPGSSPSTDRRQQPA